MAVWIRIGKDTVGCEEGVIRRADFAALSRAEQIPEAAAAQAQDLMAQARREAQARTDAADAEAKRLRSEAQQIFAQAQMQGMSQGLRQASTEWAAKAIDAAGARRRHMNRGSERLSQVVSTAVEKIIGKEDPVKLFRRSLGTVLKLMRDAPLLTMKVHADDAQNAHAAVESLAGTLPEKLRIEVEVDPEMPRGGCRFESDEGIIDTSLQTQLDALRRALDRTVTALASPDAAEADADAGGGISEAGAPAGLAGPEPADVLVPVQMHEAPMPAPLAQGERGESDRAAELNSDVGAGASDLAEADQEQEQLDPQSICEPEPQPAAADGAPGIRRAPPKRALDQKPVARTAAVKKPPAKPAAEPAAKKSKAARPAAKNASAKRAPAKKQVPAAKKAAPKSTPARSAAPRAAQGSTRRKAGR